MLAHRVARQLQFGRETHIELVIVPKRYIGRDLQGIARILPIFKVVIPDNYLLEGGGARHHEFKYHVLNFNLASFVISGFHDYRLCGFLSSRVLKVFTSHSEGLAGGARCILDEIFNVE